MGLPTRLKPLLKWLKPSMVVADIGANHGYLARDLSRLTSQPIYASELSQASVAHLRHAVEDTRVTVYQADGLQHVPSNVNTVVLTGMGGRLIEKILSLTPFPAHIDSLWLGPQSHEANLRHYVATHGWKIIEEVMVEEQDHFYVFLNLVRGEESLTDAQAYLGPRLMESLTPTFLRWVQVEYQRLQTLSTSVSLTIQDQHRLQWLYTYVQH